jgi:DNA/RNA endonuclease G (NUC1)
MKSAKTLNKIALQYQAAMPVSSIKELSDTIEFHASLGAELCELFIAEKISETAVKQLRKSGFAVSYVKFVSNNNWRLVNINWESPSDR